MCDFPKQLNIIHENSKTIEFNHHDSINSSKKRPKKSIYKSSRLNIIYLQFAIYQTFNSFTVCQQWNCWIKMVNIRVMFVMIYRYIYLNHWIIKVKIIFAFKYFLNSNLIFKNYYSKLTNLILKFFKKVVTFLLETFIKY
jgi:hypothetical protein